MLEMADKELIRHGCCITDCHSDHGFAAVCGCGIRCGADDDVGAGEAPGRKSRDGNLRYAHTDRTYQLATILASIGALAAFPFSWGTFAGFIAVAVSFQIAENFMLPAMRRAAETGEEMPYKGTRSRLELLQAAFLAVIFFKTSMPPLLTLASVYGI
jgi:hypothetical protein